MAESVMGLKAIRETFDLEKRDLRTYSPLALAYIGDGIFDLIVRSVLVLKGSCPVKKLHKEAIHMVSATAQSAMINSLLPLLTEEEEAVYRRGRNAHPGTMAKNAPMSDYRRATGFEALIGYLYLKEEDERLLFLVRQGLSLLETGQGVSPLETEEKENGIEESE